MIDLNPLRSLEGHSIPTAVIYASYGIAPFQQNPSSEDPLPWSEIIVLSKVGALNSCASLMSVLSPAIHYLSSQISPPPIHCTFLSTYFMPGTLEVVAELLIVNDANEVCL